MWRKARLRSDCYFRKPARRKDVRTLRLQSFEPRRNYQIQSLLSALGLSEHSNQKPGDVRAAFGHIALPPVRILVVRALCRRVSFWSASTDTRRRAVALAKEAD